MASGISDAQLQPRGTRHKKSASDTFAFVAGKLLEEQEGRLSLLPDVGYEEGAAFQELGFEQDALLAELDSPGASFCLSPTTSMLLAEELPGLSHQQQQGESSSPHHPSASRPPPLQPPPATADGAGIKQEASSPDQHHTRANALDTSALDPRRARRILANRQSAQRSRMKRLKYIHDLEGRVGAAQASLRAAQDRAAQARKQKSAVQVEMAAQQQELEQLQAQVAAQEEVRAALTAQLAALSSSGPGLQQVVAPPQLQGTHPALPHLQVPQGHHNHLQQQHQQQHQQQQQQQQRSMSSEAAAGSGGGGGAAGGVAASQQCLQRSNHLPGHHSTSEPGWPQQQQQQQQKLSQQPQQVLLQQQQQQALQQQGTALQQQQQQQPGESWGLRPTPAVRRAVVTTELPQTRPQAPAPAPAIAGTWQQQQQQQQQQQHAASVVKQDPAVISRSSAGQQQQQGPPQQLQVQAPSPSSEPGSVVTHSSGTPHSAPARSCFPGATSWCSPLSLGSGDNRSTGAVKPCGDSPAGGDSGASPPWWQLNSSGEGWQQQQQQQRPEGLRLGEVQQPLHRQAAGDAGAATAASGVPAAAAAAAAAADPPAAAAAAAAGGVGALDRTLAGLFQEQASLLGADLPLAPDLDAEFGDPLPVLGSLDTLGDEDQQGEAVLLPVGGVVGNTAVHMPAAVAAASSNSGMAPMLLDELQVGSPAELLGGSSGGDLMADG